MLGRDKADGASQAGANPTYIKHISPSISNSPGSAFACGAYHGICSVIPHAYVNVSYCCTDSRLMTTCAWITLKRHRCGVASDTEHVCIVSSLLRDRCDRDLPRGRLRQKVRRGLFYYGAPPKGRQGSGGSCAARQPSLDPPFRAKQSVSVRQAPDTGRAPGQIGSRDSFPTPVLIHPGCDV